MDLFNRYYVLYNYLTISLCRYKTWTNQLQMNPENSLLHCLTRPISLLWSGVMWISGVQAWVWRKVFHGVIVSGVHTRCPSTVPEYGIRWAPMYTDPVFKYPPMIEFGHDAGARVALKWAPD